MVLNKKKKTTANINPYFVVEAGSTEAEMCSLDSGKSLRSVAKRAAQRWRICGMRIHVS